MIPFIAFPKLYHRLWNVREDSLKTKFNVHRTLVITTVLCGSESWAPCRNHIHQLDVFHKRCLCTICGYYSGNEIYNINRFSKREIGDISNADATTPGWSRCAHAWRRNTGNPHPGTRINLIKTQILLIILSRYLRLLVVSYGVECAQKPLYVLKCHAFNIYVSQSKNRWWSFFF